MGKQREYSTFNYPDSTPGGQTLLTGIRAVDGSKKQVYISGFYNAPDDGPVTAFIYKGKLNGKGTWHPLSYPSSSGVTVVSTNLYGPNNGKKHNTIQVVGNYTTAETGPAAIGCLYEGPLDGSGTWTTLTPTSDEPVLNTIAHSTMGGLVVGNYDTLLIQGKAFLYEIESDTYYDISDPNAKSMTAYGIWHNGDHSYTICGSYTNLNLHSGIATGYLVDWNNKKKRLSNLRTYSYNNDPVTAIITHFDGISGSDNEGQYYLTGDTVSLGTESVAFFARVIGDKAKWSIVAYPNGGVTSGNSVLKNVVIGVYTTDNGVNGYVSA